MTNLLEIPEEVIAKMAESFTQEGDDSITDHVSSITGVVQYTAEVVKASSGDASKLAISYMSMLGMLVQNKVIRDDNSLSLVDFDDFMEGLKMDILQQVRRVTKCTLTEQEESGETEQQIYDRGWVDCLKEYNNDDKFPTKSLDALKWEMTRMPEYQPFLEEKTNDDDS